MPMPSTRDPTRGCEFGYSSRRAEPRRPHSVRPTKPFHRDGYLFEDKYDGWRMLAYKNGRRVRLVSRRGVDHTERFAEIARAIARLPAPSGSVIVIPRERMRREGR